jgi:hypothetical protein
LTKKKIDEMASWVKDIAPRYRERINVVRVIKLKIGVRLIEEN